MRLILLVLAGVVISLLFGLATPVSAAWHNNTVIEVWVTDPTLAFDSHDRPCISYEANQELWYAHRGMIEVHGIRVPWWFREQVDNVGGGGGPSLVLNGNDMPRVSYVNGSGSHGDLRYAWKDQNGWHTVVVDPGELVALDTSLALDSRNRPRICYTKNELGSFHLYYAWKDGNGWHFQSVNTNSWESELATSPSVAVDRTDKTHISYRDFHNGELCYLVKTSGGWSKTVVDQTGEEGGGGSYPYGTGTSLALTSRNKPGISYRSESTGDLRYAWKDANGWHTTTVDSSCDAAQSSLAFDSQNRPRIAYVDLTHTTLKYAWKDASGWHTMTVDGCSNNYLIADPDIALNSHNKPGISYHSEIHVGAPLVWQLKYAWSD